MTALADFLVKAIMLTAMLSLFVEPREPERRTVAQTVDGFIPVDRELMKVEE